MRAPHDRCIWPDCSVVSYITVGVYVRQFGLCERHWDRWARKTDAEKNQLAREWRRGRRVERPITSPFVAALVAAEKAKRTA